MEKRRPTAINLNPNKVRDKKIIDHIEQTKEDVGTSHSEQFKRAMEFYMKYHKVSVLSNSPDVPYTESSSISLEQQQKEQPKEQHDPDKPLLGKFGGFQGINSDMLNSDNDE